MTVPAVVWRLLLPGERTRLPRGDHRSPALATSLERSPVRGLNQCRAPLHPPKLHHIPVSGEPSFADG